MARFHSTDRRTLGIAIVLGVAVAAALDRIGAPMVLAVILGIAMGCGLYALNGETQTPKPPEHRD